MKSLIGDYAFNYPKQYHLECCKIRINYQLRVKTYFITLTKIGTMCPALEKNDFIFRLVSWILSLKIDEYKFNIEN